MTYPKPHGLDEYRRSLVRESEGASMIDDLKLCPFCGGDASVNTCRTSDQEFIRLNGRDTGYGVNCWRCGVNNRGISIGYATEQEAIAAWNTRKDAP